MPTWGRSPPYPQSRPPNVGDFNYADSELQLIVEKSQDL